MTSQFIGTIQAQPTVRMIITDPRLDGYQGDIKDVAPIYPMPQYESAGAAGIDLRAMIDEDSAIVPAGGQLLVPTGIRLDMEGTGLCCVALPRSGAGTKRKLVLGNLVGLIDNDYQGQVMICIWNRGSEPATIESGERLAQLVFLPQIQAHLEPVQSFDHTTERGSKGFGHSGTK